MRHMQLVRVYICARSAPIVSRQTGFVMARFRRRKVYRRKPVRRARRYARRRFKRGHRSGSLYCKLTKIEIYNCDNTKNEFLQLGFQPDNFGEYDSLARNFEFCKFLKVRVTILPLQNVSNASTSIMPCYVMTPWHYSVAIPTDFNKMLSMDKAKVARGTRVMSQTYVPSLQICNEVSVSPIPPDGSAYNSVIWRPQIRTTRSGSDPNKRNLPYIHTGLAAFQGSAAITNKSSAYNIKWDVWVKFSGQSTIQI